MTQPLSPSHRDPSADNAPLLGGQVHGPVSGREPRLGGRAIVSDLLEALRGRDLQARLAAGRTLKQIRDPQAVELLLGALADDHMQVRSVAAAALGAIAEDSPERARMVAATGATPALLHLLRDRHIPVRMASARALGQIGDPEALPGLLDALRDVSPHVRGNAAAALGSMGALHPERGAELIPPLIAALGDADSGVRALSALALGRVAAAHHDPALRGQVVPALLNTFRDSSVNVRTNAAWALGLIGPDAVPAMIHALRDEQMQVRSAAASVLKQVAERHGRASKAVDALIAALDDVDETVRWYAIGALGVIRDPRAVPHLVRVLDDMHKPYPFDEMRICDIAAEALERIGTPEARAAVRIWRVSRWLR